jgi:hypothetical protein
MRWNKTLPTLNGVGPLLFQHSGSLPNSQSESHFEILMAGVTLKHAFRGYEVVCPGIVVRKNGRGGHASIHSRQYR